MVSLHPVLSFESSECNLMSYFQIIYFTAVSVGFQLDASDLRFLPPR